jgi:hypothetical protein
MGDQGERCVYVVSYVDAQGRVAHLPIDRVPAPTATGYAFRLQNAPPGAVHAPLEFSSFNEWLLTCRSFLRFNYDRSGVPDFRVRCPLPLPEVPPLRLEGPAESCRIEGPLPGPEEGRAEHYGLVWSTYPSDDGLWQLLCDRFVAEVYPGWKAMCLADGCNWGPRPRTAAWKASAAFLEFVRANASLFQRTKEVGYLLLKAFSVAHERIIEGLEGEQVWDAGTTTLIGGVLLPLDEGTGPHDPRYGLVVASVGDCKCFVYSPREGRTVDVTLGNRGGIDATDPGGRLGPYVGRFGEPDLRNLHLYFATARDGDIILLCSDGVHDNLDAFSLGKSPSDIGLQASDWKELAGKEIGLAKSQFMCQKLEQVLAAAQATDARKAVLALIKCDSSPFLSSSALCCDHPLRR